MMEDNILPNSLIFENIERKVKKWIAKHKDDIEDHEINPQVFQDVMIVILGAYCTYRQDIGFMSGLEKITAQFLLIYLPY
jgi:hypothetical protein